MYCNVPVHDNTQLIRTRKAVETTKQKEEIKEEKTQAQGT
jgi:hypothetical protein